MAGGVRESLGYAILSVWINLRRLSRDSFSGADIVRVKPLAS